MIKSQIMSEAEGDRINFKPDIRESIENHESELKRAKEQGYNFTLDHLDLTSSSLAHKILQHLSIDHASPSGSLAFKTAEERLNAILGLIQIDPNYFCWRWTEVILPSSFEFSEEEWLTKLKSQQIDKHYLVVTSKDPKLNYQTIPFVLE